MAVVELKPHYYRDNFLLLCNTVEARYADLLAEDEQSVLDRLRGVSFESQCLYVRLISRTGPWFRESKLHYPEIGALHPAIDELLAVELAVEAEELEVAELGGLFTRAELQQSFENHFGRQRFRSKDDLLEAIETLDLSARKTLRMFGQAEPARIIAPLHWEVIELLQLLFFGNRYQSLTEFVLSDLGVVQYFPYPLERRERLFENREALDEYLFCGELADRHYELLELDTPGALPALAREVAALEVTFDSSASRFYRLCNNLARDLERIEERELALALYQRSARHPARERRARILETRGEFALAKHLCEQIIDQPWCEAEQEAATRILPRVLRGMGERPPPRGRDKFSEFTLELTREDRPVELLAAEHLRGDWRDVHYVENSLMNTLFGLAFWEEIFMPLPGAFHHAYQGGPTDIFEQGFRQRRATAIDKRMSMLRRSQLSTLLPRAFARYHPCHCHWTDWRYIDAALVEAASRIIPRAHLLAVFERLLFDPGENRRGFPDLIALGQQPGEYCLIEVKGPGDALQDSQKRWLRYFARQDIPAQVSWVQWIDD